MLPQLELVRTLLPIVLFVLLSLLAYAKVAIVLQVLRRGIGGGVPPLLVTVMLGLSLATLSMSPVLKRCLTEISTAPPSASTAELVSLGTAPLQQFLIDHTPPSDKAQVQALTKKLAEKQGATVDPNELPVLVAAFLLSELRIAFQIAFLLLLPFLVLDLLAALLLSGLQLGGLSVRAVTLPCKLLLFLVCDGFTLLYRGLLLGYS